MRGVRGRFGARIVAKALYPFLALLVGWLALRVAS